MKQRFLVCVGAIMMGCSPPHLDVADCEMGCTNDQGCVNGMVCLGNRCVSPSRVKGCPMSAGTGSTATTASLGGSAGSLNSMTGGAGTKTEGGGAGATAGGNTTGGNTAEGGYGGSAPGGMGGIGGSAPGGSGGTCQLNGSPPSEACTNRPYQAVFDAGCPVDSFVWTLTTAVDNLKIEKGDSAHPEVSGTPSSPCPDCQLSFAVYPAPLSGNQSFPLRVYATPRVTTTALPDACVNELYDVTLGAEGGDSAQYVWTANIPEGTGLSIQDGHLKGLINASGETPRDVNVELTVKDQHCISDTIRLTLHILGSESTVCPTILIEGTSPDWPAPPACKGQPYSLKVTATDGVPDYFFGHSIKPAGFEFDPLTRALKATNASEPGDFVVQVSDQSGRVIQKTYRIDVRDKCWLGYVSKETGIARLQLFDPLLNKRITLPARATATESVIDFQFSPDGRFLACRLNDSGTAKPQRLVVIRVADQRELEPTFAGSVTQYAWSDNSEVLAVAHGPSKADTLGGIAITTDWETVMVLKGVPAAVDNSLIWYGRGDYVAFDAVYTAAAALRTPYSSQLLRSETSVPNGFATPLTVEWPGVYEPPLRLCPASSGYWVIASGNVFDFYLIGSDTYAFHTNVAISQRGDLVGLAQDGELRLYRPEATTDEPDPKLWASAPGCEKLLTWAGNANRIACLAPDGKTITLFTYSDAAPSIVPIGVSGSYSYGDSQWNKHQRMLAHSGLSLTFSTAKYVYVTSGGDSPTVVRALARSSGSGAPGSLSSSAAISYSPNDEWVAVEADSYINLCPITKPEELCTRWLVHRMATPDCSEDVLSDSNWCGAASDFHGILWSPDSRLVGLQAEDGTLQLMDLQTLQRYAVNDSCKVECVGDYRFQP